MYREFYLTTRRCHTSVKKNSIVYVNDNQHRTSVMTPRGQNDNDTTSWESYELQAAHSLASIPLDEEDFLTLCNSLIEPLNLNSPKEHKTVKNLLLTGPAGVGKTHLVKALASECPCVIRVPVLDLLTKSRDVTKPVRSLFSYVLSKKKPCLLALDQGEILIKNSHDSQPHEKTQRIFKEIVSCIQTSAQAGGPPLAILYVCQEPWLMSSDTLSLFNSAVTLQLPDKKGREQILQNIVESASFQLLNKSISEPSDHLLQHVASETDGMVAQNLRQLLECAANYPIKKMVYKRKRLADDKSDLIFNNSDIDIVIKECSPTKNKQVNRQYEEWKTNFLEKSCV